MAYWLDVRMAWKKRLSNECKHLSHVPQPNSTWGRMSLLRDSLPDCLILQITARLSPRKSKNHTWRVCVGPHTVRTGDFSEYTCLLRIKNPIWDTILTGILSDLPVHRRLEDANSKQKHLPEIYECGNSNDKLSISDKEEWNVQNSSDSKEWWFGVI